MEAIEGIEAIEDQYQTVNKKPKENNERAEEIIRRIAPARSFLYRHEQKVEKTTTSYVPMDGNRRFRGMFRLSSYEYPFFDWKSKFLKRESVGDRGYYTCSTSNNRVYIQKTIKKSESTLQTKFKSLSTTEELNEMYTDEHFYEDLCYNDVTVTGDENDKSKRLFSNTFRPKTLKLHDLINSFKFPFFKRHDQHDKGEEVKSVDNKDKKCELVDKDANIYENSESIGDMYNSIEDKGTATAPDKDKTGLPVEEYLVPIQLELDYCDVEPKREETFVSYIISLFDKRFGSRRETSVSNQSEAFDSEIHKEESQEPAQKWNAAERKPRKSNMADRPLPVPVENEAFYMDIDRSEAENLLKGQPDGTFVLRPSSQPNHAYTLSVSCAGAVHNVGVRRRQDGRLALGFARRAERSFTNVTSLLRHHKRRRLMLVASGGVLGATTLNDTPQYYQTPSGIPVLS